jgi:hypothetical protein
MCRPSQECRLAGARGARPASSYSFYDYGARQITTPLLARLVHKCNARRPSFRSRDSLLSPRACRARMDQRRRGTASEAGYLLLDRAPSLREALINAAIRSFAA